MKIFKLAAFLGVVSVLASGVLYFANEVTYPIISAANIAHLNESLGEFYPGAEFDVEDAASDAITQKIQVTQNGENIATIYHLNFVGFNPGIDMLVAINADGTLHGIDVLGHAETPGFGSQIETNETWRSQFTTRTVNDQIDTISGATITTRAVNAAVQEAFADFKANQ